jgi:hypothetical protein
VITRTWTATDACGNSRSADQIITVVESVAPILTVPADATVECDADSTPAVTGAATAADNCDGSPVVSFNDSVAGGSCPAVSVITRTWTATDACGSSTSADQIITLVDTIPPVITCPPEVGPVAEAPAADFAGGSVSDNCDASPTVVFVSDVASGPPGEEIITRTYQAEDACGNAVTCVQMITLIEPTIDPDDCIVWHQPLARNGMGAHDTDPSQGGALKYKFKAGSTVPVKIHVNGSISPDITADPNIMATVEVFEDVNCDNVLEENEIDYNGVGDVGGLMILIGDHLHYNLDTETLVTAGCHILQVTVTDVSTGQTCVETVLLQRK